MTTNAVSAPSLRTAARRSASKANRCSRPLFAGRDDVQITSLLSGALFLGAGQLAIHTMVSGAANCLAAQAVLFLALPAQLLAVAVGQSLLGKRSRSFVRGMSSGLLTLASGGAAMWLMNATEAAINWLR